MPFSFTILAYCVVPVLLVALVLTPIIRELSKSHRPNLGEWRSLSGVIRNISKPDLTARTLSSPTRTALSVVLGDRSGQSNKQNMPLALQILDDAGHHAVASLRAAGTFSVFSGLLGTAIVFAGILPTLGESDSYRDLSHVYIINSITVLLAIFAYACARYIEGNVHEVNECATTVLNQLPDRDEADVDPLLLSTLREMTSQMQQAFQDNMGHWHEQQLGDIRAIVGEVRGLAASIGEGIKSYHQQSAIDIMKLMEANRETLTAVETSAIRLDSALGGVVNEGLPALRTLTEAADALRTASLRFESSGALAAMTSISGCVEALRRLVDVWPENLDSALRATETRVQTASVEAVRNASEAMTAAVNAAAHRVEGIVREQMSELPTSVAQASAAPMKNWQDSSAEVLQGLISTTTALRDNAQALGTASARLDDALRKLESLIEKTAGRRWPF